MTHEFTKQVAFKAVDEQNRTATGAVLVPNEVDRQQDFLRPAGVESMFAEDPDDGVMHAAFPDGAAELVRNEIVDEPIELNGEEFPAGTWVATRQYNDDDLWQLVEDGVLTGFSIGGEVDRVREYVAADVPDDVTFPTGADETGEMFEVTEIVEGTVEEVSDVDIPAVPRATYRELSKLGKSITEEVDGEAEFVEVMRERGHDEADARDLWAYLQTHKQKRAGADVEKPIVLPNGAEFDSFEACVDSVSGDGTSVAAAEQICGAGREKDVPDRYSDIDFAGYPDAAVENAERGLELRREHGRGGTQVGVTRAGQLANGERLSPDTVDRMVSFFARHEQNRPENPDPNDPSNGWIAWLLWGGDEARRWAESVVDRMDAADEEGGIERASKAGYDVGEWVTWPRLGGDSRGQVVDVIEEPGEGFSDEISGDTSVEAEEDNPVYLLEVWDGTGEDASPREDETGRGDTMHVANREDRLRSVSDPAAVQADAPTSDERAESRAGQDNPKMTEDTDDDGAEPESSEETKAAGAADIDDVDDATLGSRIKSALGLGGGADDGGNSSEDPDDAEKAGRTLSQRNRRAVMAAVDAQLDLLNDAGVDHGMTRFTDRDDVAFSIEEYGDKGQHSDDKPDKNAPGGDTPDDDMTDDINDKVDALEEKLDTLSEKLDEEDDTEAEKEDEQDDELSEKLDAIAEKVSDLDERVDKMATKTADTEQVGGAEKSAETTDEASAFKAALGGN